ncbi:MAG: HAD family hydrolase [Patescibacteria group bacterium]
MKLGNKKLVLFDFDGVLIDTLISCYQINTEVNDDLDIEEYKGFFNGNIHNSIRKNGEQREEHPEFPQKYDFFTRELKITDDLKESVKSLAMSYVLAIVSSTMTSSINQILQREGISEYFSVVLGSDIDQSKVVKIKMLLEKYGMQPENSIFITDTLGDIKEAKECSVRSIAVTWGFQSKQVLQKGAPAIIIDDPKDLVSAIENVLK